MQALSVWSWKKFNQPENDAYATGQARVIYK